jgi:hypothetical protein
MATTLCDKREDFNLAIVSFPYLVCNNILPLSPAYAVYNDLLIDYCFTFRSRIFQLYGDVTITGDGLQNLGLCTALRTFKGTGRIFIMLHLL